MDKQKHPKPHKKCIQFNFVLKVFHLTFFQIPLKKKRGAGRPDRSFAVVWFYVGGQCAINTTFAVRIGDIEVTPKPPWRPPGWLSWWLDLVWLVGGMDVVKKKIQRISGWCKRVGKQFME